jgi:CheY-like chemotaxis protein
MRILIAEDDYDISSLYKKALERRKHDVTLASTGDTCLQYYFDKFPNETSSTKLTSTGTKNKVKLSSYTALNTKSRHIRDNVASSSSASSVQSEAVADSRYDVVILDYKMPGMNGMDVAKEILEVSPHQRIIFASAYVEETLKESVKQLKQVVELMQKPFSLKQLVDTLEDKEVYEELRQLNVDVERIKAAKLTHEFIRDLLERLKKIQKNRTF